MIHFGMGLSDTVMSIHMCMHVHVHVAGKILRWVLLELWTASF